MQIRRRSVHLPFPLWQFLTQPVFKSAKIILNPFRFQHHYQIQLLQRCWDCDSVQFLERCWLKELELNNFPGASGEN